MYFDEKLFELPGNQFLALSLACNNMYPITDRETGYAYIGKADSGKVEKETDLQSISHTSKALLSRTGIGLFRLVREDPIPSEGSWHLIDIPNRKILRENFGTAWLTIDAQGEIGLRAQTVKQKRSDSQELIEMFQQLINVKPAADLGVTEEEFAAGINGMLESFDQASQYPVPTGLLECVSLTDGRIVSTFSCAEGVSIYSSWQKHWLLASQEGIEIRDIQGKIVAEYSIKGIAGIAVGQDAVCVVSLWGGDALLLNLETGETQRIRPNIGVDRADRIRVKISEDSRYMVSGTADTLVFTDLQTLFSHPLTKLPSSRNTFPDFAFIGNRLAVLHNGAVSLHDIPKKGYSPIPSDPQKPSSEDWYDCRKQPGHKRPGSNISNFSAMFAEFGLTRVADRLTSYLMPSIRFDALATAAEPGIGKSRIGGHPDLDDDAVWPCWQQRPMYFVCQIDLAEIAGIAPDSPLPKTGLLSLFIGRDGDFENHDGEIIYGLFIPAQPYLKGNEWKVLYQPDTAKLRTRSDLYPDFETLRNCGIAFSAAKPFLPEEDSPLIAALHLSDQEKEAYLGLLQHINGDRDGYYHEGTQLLGYPNTFQNNCLEMECQLLSLGRDHYDFPDKAEEMAQLTEASSVWTLLFQIGHTIHSPYDLSDFVLYLFVRRDALQRGDFSETWLTGQC